MITEIKQIPQSVGDITAFIQDNSLIPELEVWMKRSIWGGGNRPVGSRPTIYEAMKVTDWDEASLTEKVILLEAWQMMKEMEAVVMA